MPPEPPAAPDEPEDDGEPERHVWRVAELVGEVRVHLERSYADLWVQGEISNCRSAPSGHLYFTLKDGDATLPVVLFRREARLLRFRPGDGLEVLLRGRVSVYEGRGQMQIIAVHVEPVGAGSLQIAFEQLKTRLAAEGLFAADRKRLLPAFPRCVGIITSPTGAVIRDFLHVANRRHSALEVLLYPALVQGETAAAEIAAGIAYFNGSRTVDVIVVARGGGSMEDLQPFNTELLARAIAGSELPVVSAVGHETDFTIADFVADLRAPTPSAAAELITAAQHKVEERLDELAARMHRAARYALSLARNRVSAVGASSALHRVQDALDRRQQKLDDLRIRADRALTLRSQTFAMRLERAAVLLLRQDPAARIRRDRESAAGCENRLGLAMAQALRIASQHLSAPANALTRHDAVSRLRARGERLETLTTRTGVAASHQLARATQRVALAEQALGSLSPLAVLQRGYALVYSSDGNLLTTAQQAHAGDAIDIRLARGTVAAQVTRTTHEPEDA